MSCLKGQAGTVHELMEAALVEQERGRAGLLNWFEQGRPLDPLATRLLPFLYERYREHDLPVALRERLGGAYRLALLQGQARRRQCWQLFADPFFAEPRWMVLKGVALAELYYKNWAVRPMSDVDLVAADPEGCLSELLQRGWRLQEQHAHAASLFHPKGLALDLHHRALSECRWPGADDDFWQLLQRRELLWTPCPEHFLLHVCLHGSKTDERSSPWMLDALQVLRAEPQLNWELFWEAARRRRLAVAAAEALAPLRDHVALPPLPRGGPWMERMYARVRRWPKSRGGRYLVWDAFEHFRNVPGASPTSYARHLGQRWGARSPLEFLAVLMFRGLREASQGPRSRLAELGPRWSEVERKALGCCLNPAPLEDWEQWLRQAPGVRRLSGYLAARCASPPRVLQLAQVYEQRRWQVFRERTAEVLLAVQQLDPAVARGPALAERYYDQPWQRHCHGLDLWLDGPHRMEAERILEGLGYSATGAGWRHPGGFEVMLHEQLLPEPLQLDWVRAPVCGVEVRVLEGADLLALLLAHGGLQRVPLSWGLDVALVLQRHRNQWPLVAPLLERAGLALAASAAWQGVASSLGWELELKRAPVPSQGEWETLFRAERRRGLSRRQLWSRLGQWEARARLLWWLLGAPRGCC